MTYVIPEIALNAWFDRETNIVRVNFELIDGRELSIFVNRQTMLIVVDTVDFDENGEATGGNEFIRRKIPAE